MPEATLAFGDESPLAHVIREALGVGDYDEVRCTLPQFERNDGREIGCIPGKQITYRPRSKMEFDALKAAPEDILVDIGMQRWDEDIWLFPAEWYDFIPKGYEIVDICGERKQFEKGVTDNDKRHGALSFGFRRKEVEDG